MTLGLLTVKGSLSPLLVKRKLGSQPGSYNNLHLERAYHLRRWRQRMRWLDGFTHTMDMNLGKVLGDGKG